MTKAELFRYLAERAGWWRKRAAAPAAERARGEGARADRVSRKAGYALEISAGRPSRKSTRRAANRNKTDGQFRMKRRVAESRVRDFRSQ